MASKCVEDAEGAPSPKSPGALQDLSYSALFSLLDHQATMIRLQAKSIEKLSEDRDRYLTAWIEEKGIKAQGDPNPLASLKREMGEAWDDLPEDMKMMVPGGGGAAPPHPAVPPQEPMSQEEISARDEMAMNYGLGGGQGND